MANLRGGRASLVKTLTAKMESDRELQEFDKKLWYNVDLEKISDPGVRAKFVQLDRKWEGPTKSSALCTAHFRYTICIVLNKMPCGLF